jgi:hypothetical protein
LPTIEKTVKENSLGFCRRELLDFVDVVGVVAVGDGGALQAELLVNVEDPKDY